MLSEEQIIAVTKKVARSFDISFKYRKGDRNLEYVCQFDALIGNPIHSLSYLVKKATDQGLHLDSQEQFKALHNKVWHESMHGKIAQELGEASAYRQIPEDYWLYKEEAKRFGRDKFDGVTINIYLDCQEAPLEFLQEIEGEKIIDKSFASTIALILFCKSKKTLTQVSNFWEQIKKLCQPISSISEINDTCNQVQEILEPQGIKALSTKSSEP